MKNLQMRKLRSRVCWITALGLVLLPVFKLSERSSLFFSNNHNNCFNLLFHNNNPNNNSHSREQDSNHQGEILYLKKECQSRRGTFFPKIPLKPSSKSQVCVKISILYQLNVQVNTMPGLIVNKTGLQVFNLFREPVE